MQRPSSLILLSLLLLACGDKDDGGDGDGDGGQVDADSDGFPAGVDCDDSDAAINPDAAEVCDGVDNDCDDLVDDEDGDVDTTGGSTWYADGDFDGYGDAATSTVACSQPAGFVSDDSDCDDADDAVHPDAAEVCNGVDDDCDEEIDEGAEGLSTWYADADGDGYGDDETAVEACEAPEDHVEIGGDCDDAAGAVFPGAVELCNDIDDDCDPATTEDGLASFETADGTWEDWTDAFSADSGRAADVFVDTAGSLHLCEGEWLATIDVYTDLAVVGHGASRDDVVLDAAFEGAVLEVGEDGVALSARGLTIRNGVGESSTYFGVGGGGIACETADSTVTLDDVTLENHEGSYGGAVSTYQCDVEITGSLISGNSADVGAGVSVWDGDATLADTRIEDNEALDGGGVLLYGDGSSSYRLDEVTIRGNTGLYSAGGLYVSGGSGEITGGRIVGNTGDYGAGGVTAYLESTQRVDLADVDLGETDSSDDNSPYDVDGAWIPYRADDGASFTCTTDGCGRAVTSSVGGDGSSVSLSSGAYGSVITPETDVTLTELDFHAWSADGCTADAYVLSRTGDEVWQVEWSITDVRLSSSEGWSTVGSPGVLLDAGTDYTFMLAAYCSTGSVTFSYDSTGSDTSAEFGTTSAYTYPSSYSRPWTSSVTLNESTTSTLAFSTRFETTEL